MVLSPPRALLLDFGGVIADAPAQPPAPAALVDRLHTLVDGAVAAEEIARSLADGTRAYAAWRDRVGTQDAPAELTHAQVWDDFVCHQWPAAARDAVLRTASRLSYDWTWREEWALRPGMAELLQAAADARVPVAVVSNTLCGAAHRDFLDRAGLTDRFAVQIYSDEAGVRKPNPEMAWRAARELGVDVADCWFVGDTPARDIACARRAGAGVAVLMRSPRTDREQPLADHDPDETVRDGHELLTLLSSTLAAPPSGG